MRRRGDVVFGFGGMMEVDSLGIGMLMLVGIDRVGM